MEGWGSHRMSKGCPPDHIEWEENRARNRAHVENNLFSLPLSASSGIQKVPMILWSYSLPVLFRFTFMYSILCHSWKETNKQRNSVWCIFKECHTIMVDKRNFEIFEISILQMKELMWMSWKFKNEKGSQRSKLQKRPLRRHWLVMVVVLEGRQCRRPESRYIKCHYIKHIDIHTRRGDDARLMSVFSKVSGHFKVPQAQGQGLLISHSVIF